MREEHQGELEKIERVSRILEVLFVLAFLVTVAIPVACIWFMAVTPTSEGESHFFREQPMNEMTFTDDDVREGRFTLTDKVSVSTFAVLLMGCLALCFAFAIRLMRQFKKHHVFSDQSVRNAKGVAYAYSASVVILTAGTWAAAIMIGDLHLNGNLIQSFVSVGLVWLFVWIMQIGTALQVDSEMTI